MLSFKKCDGEIIRRRFWRKIFCQFRVGVDIPEIFFRKGPAVHFLKMFGFYIEAAAIDKNRRGNQKRAGMFGLPALKRESLAEMRNKKAGI